MESRRTTLYLIDERKAGSMAGRISSANRPILVAPAFIIYAPQFRLMDFDLDPFSPPFRRRFISSRKYNRKFFYFLVKILETIVVVVVVVAVLKKMGHAWKFFFPPERIREKQEDRCWVRLIFHIKSVQREFSRGKQSRALVSMGGVEREAGRVTDG